MLARVRSRLLFVLCFGLCLTSIARGELDPELAELSAARQNQSGLFVAANGAFGVSTAAGISKRGAAFLLGGDLGYTLSQGSWERIEVGFSFFNGALSFSEEKGNKGQHTTDISIGALAKLGTGYSLGQGLQAIWKVGFGPFWANHELDLDENRFATDELTTGLVGSADVGIVLNANSVIDILGGLQVNHFQYDADMEEDGSTDLGRDLSFNVNVWAVQLGLRAKL